jgi:transcriptional regulator with XRE-family HTH domain
MPSHFRENLSFAIHDRFGTAYKDKTLADALSVDRSTANRMRNSTTLPSRGKLEALSRVFEIGPEAWALPPNEFVAEYHRTKRPEEPTNGATHAYVSMAAINAYRHLWKTCFAVHKGQYIAYWKAAGTEQCYVASVLEIARLGVHGIEFELINPYIRDDDEQDELRTWRYQGVVYPVAEYLYFFGEQTEARFELLSMITTASPIVPPDVLRGCLSGIHVKDGHKQIAVNISVVFVLLKKPIVEWRREIGQRLGRLPAAKIPARIRKLIDPFPGVITLGV